MEARPRILVTGGWTLIGSALVRRLAAAGCGEILAPREDELDLHDREAVSRFFEACRPTHVYHAGGRSGGIDANRRYPADLCLDNLASTTAVLWSALDHGCSRLLYLASSCCYPRECPQPMRVESLGTGPLEQTSEAYATAKLAGMALVRAIRRQHGRRFIAGIPADVYGPCRVADPSTAHVIPSLLMRMHEAARTGADEILVWGTGSPKREFLHVDDLADACLLVMERYDSDEPVNLGGGHERTIREAAEAAARVAGFRGRIRFDDTRPDGTPRKLLDSSVLAGLGWRAGTGFEEGLRQAFAGILQLNRAAQACVSSPAGVGTA
jgi:GDP-L-fucose synthase